MPLDRTLRTIFALARANGLKEEMQEALKGTILQYGEAEQERGGATLTAPSPPPP
jgi:hypothetical protein